MSEVGGLGTAQGKITIDAADLLRIQQLTQQVGAQVSKNLSQINTGARQAQTGIKTLSQTLGDLAGNLGLATGAALAVQLGQQLIEADRLATAYRRQSVAALSLAGSQTKLNQLLNAYNEATGGAIDRANALGDVTRLQAVGFADSAEELKRFATVARGISVAMGSTQEYIIGQLQLAIANQSTMRLDQLGLGVGEVTSKVKELQKANSSLTTEMAYQNAILSIAEQKYGKLATSAAAQATGAEKAAKAWKELQLQVGEDLGPAIGSVMQALAKELGYIAEKFRGIAKDAEYAKKVIADQQWQLPDWLKRFVQADEVGDYVRNPQAATVRNRMLPVQDKLDGLQATRDYMISRDMDGRAIAKLNAEIAATTAELAGLKGELLNATTAVSGFGTRSNYSLMPGGMMPFNSPSPPAYQKRFTDDQNAAIRTWAKDVEAIEKQAGAARLAATRDYARQVAEVVAAYGKSVVREEQDFARSRAQAIRDLGRQVADVHEAAAKREVTAARDYAEALADVSADATKRESKWIKDYNERVAELHGDNNKRLIELEQDYNKKREQAAEDHQDRLFDAAARLDAVAVRNEKKNYARSEQDAAESYEEQRKKLAESLAEQLSEAQEAQQERLAEAREGDAERLADMQKAHERQLAEAREADAERLADMQEDFERRIADEDEQRAIQQQRAAEDHAEQLAQMAAAQADKMAQLAEQEANEKEARGEAFLAELEDLGIHNERWLLLQKNRQNESIKLFDEWLKDIQKKLKELVPDQGPAELRNTDPFGYANGGPVRSTRRALVHQGEYVLNPQTTAALRSQLGGFDQRSLLAAVGGRQTKVEAGAIVVNAAPGMDERLLAALVRTEVETYLEEAI